MKNRLPVILFILFHMVFVSTVFADTDLTPLYRELEVLFDEIGKDTAPHLQNYGLIMEGTGAAEIGPHFFFSLSAGSAFMPGILTFRDGDSPFKIFPVAKLLDEAVPNEGIVYDIYRLSETFFLNPGTRLSLGIGFENGLEFFGHFGIIPQFAVDLIVPILSVEGLDGLAFNRLNAGLRARKVLLSDYESFPAVSLNAGYTFTRFNAAAESLAMLPLSGFEFSGYTLDLEGAPSFKTSMHTAGIELAISKKLAFFVPFVRLGAWQQWTSYSAGISGLTITMNKEGEEPITVSGTDPLAERVISDLSFIPAGGFELRLGKMSFILLGSYNTASGSAAADLSLQFRL